MEVAELLGGFSLKFALSQQSLSGQPIRGLGRVHPDPKYLIIDSERLHKSLIIAYEPVHKCFVVFGRRAVKLADLSMQTAPLRRERINLTVQIPLLHLTFFFAAKPIPGLCNGSGRGFT